MKKFWILMAALSVLFCTGAMADDLAIQSVPGQMTSEPTFLDDVQLGLSYEIPGYARVIPVSYDVRNLFIQYDVGHVGSTEAVETRSGGDRFEYRYYTWIDDYDMYYAHVRYAESGENTQFAMFQVDLVNLHKEAFSFGQDAVVHFVYDDKYVYVGWIRQFDPDIASTVYFKGPKGGGYATTENGRYRTYIQPADELPIDMVGTGHYIFGCTLPNAVVEGEEPLRVEITLGEHFIVYYIRK